MVWAIVNVSQRPEIETLSDEIFVSGQFIGVDGDGLQLQFTDFTFLPRTSRKSTPKRKILDVDSPSNYWKNYPTNGKD
jgi:hypothetical protein